MSDRPTPETDREWDRLQMLPGGGYSSQVAGVKLAFGMARWASELERQRDEARDQLTRICREGFGDQDTISLEPCADYALRKLKEEREELLKLRVENDHNRQAVADLEKITELAREQIAKANSEHENDAQAELAAWELLKDTRELARGLRDAMKAITPYIGYPSTPTDVVYQFRNALTKAKEVLP